MVDEVVAGEGVDPVGVAGEWAAAIATTWRSRVVLRDPGGPLRADRAGSGANSAAATTVVTSSLVWARSTISAMAASPPTASWWITLSGSAGMGAAWAEPLTRR